MFWVMGNRHGGGHWAGGATAAEARGVVRSRIAEQFVADGLTESQARRGASSYQVETLGGPVPQLVAETAAGEVTAGRYVAVATLITEAGGKLSKGMLAEARKGGWKPGARCGCGHTAGAHDEAGVCWAENRRSSDGLCGCTAYTPPRDDY